MKRIYRYLKKRLYSLSPSYYQRVEKYKVIIKYVIAGGTAAMSDLVLLYALTDLLEIYYLLSASLAFIVAFFISFYLQKFWTFRDNNRDRMYKQMSLYFIVGAINLGINIGGMYVLVDQFAIMYILAQILMGGFIAVTSFLIYRFIIFKKQKAEARVNPAGKLKILIATGIYPPDIGGPATMLEALANSLLNNNFQIKVITYSDWGSQGVEDKKYNYKIIRVIKSKNITFCHFRYFVKMLWLSLWSDVIYVTDTYSTGHFAYVIKKLTRKKYIVRFAGDSAWETATSQGLIKDYIVNFQDKVYDDQIEKLKLRRKKILTSADKVIAVSYFIAGIAKKIGVNDNKVEVIYNSIDFMNSDSINKEVIDDIRSRYGKGAKIIITACRLTPWKGVDGIIKILPRLKERMGKINFLVLGEGQELNRLKKLADKLSVSSDVHFLGKVDHDKILTYFKAADLFILNTNYEALSHTLLEAMKAGVPIITTNIGGNPEVINNNQDGLLVEYNNGQQLFEAAVKIFTNQQLAKALTDGAREKLKKFNWDNNIQETIKLLKEYA